MNTAEILEYETPNRCMKHLVIWNLFKRFLALSVGAFLALCATLSADAAPLGTSAFTLKIENMTTQLLTTPMTSEQRQVRHAQNFYQLPVEHRAFYLFAVAHEVGFMAAGQILTGAEPWNIVNSDEDLNVSPSLNIETVNYWLEVAMRPASEFLADGFVGTTDTNALEVVASSALQTGRILNGLFTTTLDFGPGLRVQLSYSTQTEGIFNLNDIAAIGTQAEMYVRGLSAMIPPQVVATPTNEEAMFVGLVTGVVMGLTTGAEPWN